jgi:DNA-binding beta-propeller fold protein YncE
MLTQTIDVPGPANGRWDFMLIDPNASRLYVSDTSNESFDVIDTKAYTIVAQIKGLPGNNDPKNGWSGANGAAIAPELNRAWVADQVDNSVHVYDLTSLQQTSVVSTTQKGSDSVVYDSVDKKLYVSNGDSQTITVFDPRTMNILKQIDLPGSPEVAAWDPFDNTLRQNISDQNGQVVIDPKTDTVRYGLPYAPGCEPHGLGIDPRNQWMVVGCRGNVGMIVDGGQGDLISATSHIGGADLSGYDPVDNRFYVAAANAKGGPQLGVYNASTGDWMGSVKTDKGAHSLVIDPTTGNIYVGAGGAGKIFVYLP